MKKLIDTLGLTFLFGALIGALEGLGVMVFLELRFHSPVGEMFDIEVVYGLLCLALLPIAWLMATLLRLPRKAGAELAGWSFLGLAWIITNWWVQGEVLRNIPITSMRSLAVLLGTTVIVFGLHWLIRKTQGKKTFGALVASLVALPLLAHFTLQAPQQTPGSPASQADMPDITVVVIDTLRADHLGTYGYKREDGEETSPFIDSLAEQGVVFESAWSQAPWTRPSMASLHSGLFCSGHSVNESFDTLPPAVTTMAEMALEQGYRTAGFSANANVGVTYGFGQGFEQLWTVGQQRSLASFSRWGELQHKVVNKILHGFLWDGDDYAELVNKETFEWLDSVADDDRPKFTYVHYIDPHTPYTPPEGGWYFSTGPDDLSVMEPFMSQRGKGFEFPFGAYDDPGKEIVDLVIKAYDAEIRYVDTELKNLIDKLKNLGQLDENDWLFITADHGEEFYERGGWGHGHSLFEDQIHVPLIVLGPDMGKGLRQPQEVNLLDVHTTIGDITGYSPMPASPGASLRPLGDGQRHTEGNQERILYSERLQGTRQLYAVRQGNLKMIERPDDEARAADPDSLDTITMWFDLEANPSEDPGFDFRDLIEGPNSKWRELPPFQDPPDELSGMMVHARGPDMALKGAVEGATARMTPAEIQALIEMGYLTKDGKAIHGGAGFKATSDEND